MKTAAEVLDRIDAEIEQMQAAAAGPCIDALIEWTDREAYREAMRRAYGLKAVRALRERISADVDAPTEPVPKANGRKPRIRARTET